MGCGLSYILFDKDRDTKRERRVVILLATIHTMGKVTLSIKKIKSTAQLSNAYDHNERIRFCENTDKSKRDQNRLIYDNGTTYSNFYKEKIRQSPVYNGRGKRTIRRDAVRAVDICIRPSREGLKDNLMFDLDKFCENTKEWAFNSFGKENIAGITLHMDEVTPHIHCVFVPMTEDGRLCSVDYIGSPEKLSKLHDTLAEHLQEIGLQRGRKRSTSRPDGKINFDKIKDFYDAINEIRSDALPAPLKGETVEQYFIRANNELKDIRSQDLARLKSIQRELDDAKTTLEQIRHGDTSERTRLEDEKKALEAKLKELESRQKNLKQNEDALKQWQDVVYAIQHGLLPSNDQKALLDGLSKALSATKKEREKEPNFKADPKQRE